MPTASRGGRGLLQADRRHLTQQTPPMAPCLWNRTSEGRSHEGTSRLMRSEEREQQGGRWDCSLSPGQGTRGQEHLRHWGSGVPLSLPSRGGPDLGRAWGAHRAFSGGPHSRASSTPGCRRVSGTPRSGLLQALGWLHGANIHHGRRGLRQPPGVLAGLLGNGAGVALASLPFLPQPPKQQGAEPRGRASFRP